MANGPKSSERLLDLAIRLTLGRNIREAREKKKFSVAELAERTGCARSLIHQIEIGHRPGVRLASIYRIAEALDTDVRRLLP